MIKIIILIAILLLSSCVTQRKCEEKFGECGRIHNYHTIEYRDTTFYLKGETIYDTLAFWQRDTIRITDSTGRLTAEIGRIRDTKTHYIRITSKPDTIQIERVKTVIKEGSVKYVNRDKVPFYYWILLGVSLFFMVFFMIRR